VRRQPRPVDRPVTATARIPYRLPASLRYPVEMTSPHTHLPEPMQRVHQAVRRWYSERFRGGPIAADYPTGRAGALALGYDHAAIEAAPPELLESFCGVGNPLALGPPARGERVLDVGCGGGFEVFVAARCVGPRGRAQGIDLTPEMVGLANAGLAKAGLGWAQVNQGSAEQIPCETGAFDLVISNGALNLSPDKERAFGEIYRVLRGGGRLQFADIVRGGDGLCEAAGDPDAWSQ